LSFKSLELGNCNPSWTPLTMSGASVFGGAVELNPWYVYTAAAVGRAQRRVPVSDSTQGAYARMLYSGRFGFGKKERTHFFLTAVYATDDTTPPENNWQPNPNDTTQDYEVVRPQENYVVGAEFNLDLYDGAFRLESELAGCEVTRDKRLPVQRWDWLPEWMANTFKPRISSSVDFAFRVRPVVSMLETKVYGKVEMVGPGFSSMGAPGLRGDNFAVGGGIERSFMDNAISASLAYTTEHDNLLKQKVAWTDTVVEGAETTFVPREKVLALKSRTSRFTNWEAGLGLTFPNLPYLQLGYYPYTQDSDSLDEMGKAASTTTTRGNVISVSAGHSFQTGTLSQSPSVSVSYNDVRGPSSDRGDCTSWDLGLNHSLGFEFPLTLSAGAGYSHSVSATATDASIRCDLTPSYTAFKVWRNSLTLGGSFGTGTRYDVRLNSSVPVWKICDASVGVSEAIYSGDDGSYTDFRLTGQLSKSW
jgi:hypothetical protein